MTVDLYVIERHSLAFKSLKDEVVYGPEGVLGEAVGSQSVLIAHHYEFEVEVLPDERHASEYATCEFQFCKRVNLLVFRFLDDSTVTVYEQ